jgi:hypothetical protein
MSTGDRGVHSRILVITEYHQFKVKFVAVLKQNSLAKRQFDNILFVLKNNEVYAVFVSL